MEGYHREPENAKRKGATKEKKKEGEKSPRGRGVGLQIKKGGD